MIESPEGFANELVDTFDRLDEVVGMQSRAIKTASTTLRLERKTSTALFEMVQEYSATIDFLDEQNAALNDDNDDLECALKAAQGMIDSFQKLSGPSLLWLS
jgi:hypothetical protein